MMLSWLFEPNPWQDPQVRLRLRLRPEVSIYETATGVLNVTHFWGATRLDGVPSAVTATLQRMVSRWVESSELWSGAVESGITDVAKLAAFVSGQISVLDRLCFLLKLQLVRREQALMTIEPLSYGCKLAFDNAAWSSPRLSPFAFLQRHADGLAMESAVASHRVVLHDEWGAALISQLSPGSPAASNSHGDDTVLAAINLLGSVGMLEGSEQASATGFGDDLLQM